MNKIFSFIAILFSATILWASNTITYTATERLPGYKGSLDIGATTFGPAIINHEFSDNKGTIICEGEITKIGEYAFARCSSLTSVSIPSSVTTIGYAAFGYCSSLSSIDLPNSVTTIGEASFYNCSSLNSISVDAGNSHYCSIDRVLFNYNKDTLIQYPIGDTRTEYTIPNSATTIGEYAFARCSSLTSIEIPNSVTTIGHEAFGYCSSLNSITIGNSVTTIGESSFYNCSSLTSIYLPNSVTTIGNWAFYGCSVLTSIIIPDSVTTIGYAAFYECSSLTSITIPYSVTTIGEYAFTRCSSLPSIHLPNSLTTIGRYAFYECSSLTSITIPYSVTAIGKFAFTRCSRVSSISVDAGNSHYCSIDGVLFNYAKDTIIQYPIGNELSQYTIPYSVSAIGNDVFNHSNLVSITIPNSVISIGNGAFNTCEKLVSIEIPNSVTSLGSHAFYKCSSLTTISIPESVKTIGHSAFEFCQGFKSITCSATIPPLIPTDTSAFFGCDYSIPLYVPAGSKEAYQTAPEWRKFTNVYDIISSVDSITTTTAVIKWQKVDSAVSYTLSVIETESADTVARYEIDSTGNIIKELRSLPHNVPQMILDTTVSSAEIFEVSLTNLSSGTTYTYAIDAKDSESTIINSSAGSFTTKSETAINTIKEKKTFYHRPINILGQPIDPKTHQGIYIQNGKKYLNIW